MFGVQFLVGTRTFLFSKISTPALGPTQTPFIGYQGLFPRG